MSPSLTPCLHELFLRFAPCFTRPGLANFTALVTGLILCQGRHTISRAIQAAGEIAGGKHHSAFYRFLAAGSWVPDEVGRVLFSILLPYLPHTVIALVDDTLHRRGGPHLWGAAMHHDGANSTYGKLTVAGRYTAFSFGHNWVVLAVWVPLPWAPERGMALPLLFRLYRSKRRCPKSHYRKRTELAVELLEVFESWLPAKRSLHVVADSEYSSRTVVRPLPLEAQFTGSMPMDAALFARPGRYSGMGRPRVRGKRLPSPAKLAKSKAKTRKWRRIRVKLYGRDVTLQVKTIDCLWFTVAKQRLVRVVVTRPVRGDLEDRAYFSTDTSLSPEEILANYARRWSLEVAFRNAKQTMGVTDPQNGWWRRKHGTRRAKKQPGPRPRGNRGRHAVERTFPLCFYAYALTIAWYLANGEPKRDVARAMAEAPWYRHKRRPSFRDMLAALRRELWAAGLSGGGRSGAGPPGSELALPGWLLAA